MYSFEELEQKCKRYRLKRGLLAFFAIFLFVGGGYFLVQNISFDQKLIKQLKPPTQKYHTFSSSSSSSFTSLALSSAPQKKRLKAKKRCFGVQVMYVHENYLPQLLKRKAEIKKLGIACHIVYGRLLSNNQRQLFLVCATKRRKKELTPVIALFKQHHIEYVIVRDSCKYLSKTFIAQRNTSTHLQSSSASSIKTPSLLTDNIIKTKEMTLEQLQRLYRVRKNYEVAIKIAQAYYHKGAYEAAREWARKANRLNREKEEAWILYAKALHKLHQTKKAKQLLKIFLDYKESKEAKELLKKW